MSRLTYKQDDGKLFLIQRKRLLVAKYKRRDELSTHKHLHHHSNMEMFEFCVHTHATKLVKLSSFSFCAPNHPLVFAVSAILLMETRNHSAAAPGPARPLGNHTLKHKSFHSHPIHHHSLALSSTSILIIIISVIVLLAVLILFPMLRRLKSAKIIDSFKDNDSNIRNNSCSFVVHTTASFTFSPDVKGGCLYGSNADHRPPRKPKGVQVFTYKELQAATGTFTEANVIGNGDYGVVYRGVLADGTTAAIKTFRRDRKQGERAFRIEVDLLSRLHSPYLVELLGYCADQHHRLLIFEIMPNGTLQDHLYNHKQYQLLDWGTRLRIAFDCARALEFLHEHTVPAVIHRHLTCSNILLDRNFRAKLSDFGFAKTSSDKINGQRSARAVGTTRYLAPEYASTGELTTKSDVFSYGVVLLQLLTGRIPVDKKRPRGEHVLVSWALPRLTNREKIVEMVDAVLRGNYSKKDLIQR